MSERVLIFGASGMLGHRVWQVFRDRFETQAVFRGALPAHTGSLFDARRAVLDVNVLDDARVAGVVRSSRPTLIINCVGVVKQLAAADDPITAISINALFPHRLHACSRDVGARLIHISTDCVFSGARGGYSETDVPDATDLYGRTKLLGEITGDDVLTLRTSMIGRELDRSSGLLEWLLAQRGGRVRGYRRARFSGLTTDALAHVLAFLAERRIAGQYHVASAPIDKFDLLVRINDALGLKIAIEPSDDVVVDRTLDGSRFAHETGYVVPTWDSMIRSLASDPTPYDEWRRSLVR